jgi:diguanylate cyclase (GGDEF)-like protein
MNLLSYVSLRHMLTLPYVVLLLTAAAIIGWLSYTTGNEAVDTLSDTVVTETVGRIAQAVDKHIAGSEAVLETAFPPDIPAPASVKDDIEALRTRFWLATSINREANNYAYYGNNKGHFFGLWRESGTEAELRLRTDDRSARQIYRYATLYGALRPAALEERIFDPRERPWFKMGQSAAGHTWTGVYVDFKTQQLVATRARRVANAAGEFEGVVATDVSLQHLSEFLKGLKLSANGFAFIVEQNGNLLATSRGAHLRKRGEDASFRMNAATSNDQWIALTYNIVKSLIGVANASTGTRTSAFAGPDGELVQVGYARLRDRAGLDWIVVAGVPRNDFMFKVTQSVQRTVWLAVLACVLIAAIGLAVLNIISKELRKLAAAARDVGAGKLDSDLPVHRNDEIGELAQSFAHMQRLLRTDRLTGIANREAMLRRIEERVVRRRRRDDNRPFAVLLLELNQFRQINDQFGHDVGDRVLAEIARRLEGNLRGGDLAARFSGDEFAVFLDDIGNQKDAETAREKLHSLLAEPLQSLGAMAPEQARFTGDAAIGLALCPEHGSDLRSLLKHADQDISRRKQV